MSKKHAIVIAMLIATMLGVTPAVAMADGGELASTAPANAVNVASTESTPTIQIVDEAADLSNDSIESAEEMLLNTTVRGTMRNKADQDWYSLTLPSEGALTVVVEEGNTVAQSAGWQVELWTKKAAEGTSETDIQPPTTVLQSNDARTTTYEFGTLPAGSYYVHIKESGSDITPNAIYLVTATHVGGINWDPDNGKEDTQAKIAKISMYRLYNPWTGEHFYTASVAERSNLKKHGWKTEGIGWYAPESGVPVYRLYNPWSGDHHFTRSAKEVRSLIKVGWRSEGIGWYSASSKSANRIPVFRQYNPWADEFYHNYTASISENQMLVHLGWRSEGIGWYGVV